MTVHPVDVMTRKDRLSAAIRQAQEHDMTLLPTLAGFILIRTNPRGQAIVGTYDTLDEVENALAPPPCEWKP